MGYILELKIFLLDIAKRKLKAKSELENLPKFVTTAGMFLIIFSKSHSIVCINSKFRPLILPYQAVKK